MKRSAQSQIANSRSNGSSSLPWVLSKGSTTFLRLARDRPLRSKSYRIKLVQVFKSLPWVCRRVQKFKDRFGGETFTFREFSKGRDLETGMKEPSRREFRRSTELRRETCSFWKLSKRQNDRQSS